MLSPRTGFAGFAAASLHSDTCRCHRRKCLQQDVCFLRGSVQPGSSCHVNQCPWVSRNDSGGIQEGKALSILAVTAWKLTEAGAQGDREEKALKWGSGMGLASRLCGFLLLSFSFSAANWREGEQRGVDRVRSQPYDSKERTTGLHSFTWLPFSRSFPFFFLPLSQMLVPTQ